MATEREQVSSQEERAEAMQRELTQRVLAAEATRNAFATECINDIRMNRLSQDAAVWVLIAAFIGLALAWSGGGVAPWIGALIGGAVAWMSGAILITVLNRHQAAENSSHGE